MQKRKLIRVTKRDIELGWDSGTYCPIFRAVARTLRMRGFVVLSKDIKFFDDSGRANIALPREAAKFSTKQSHIGIDALYSNSPMPALKAKAMRILKPFSFVLKYGGEE